MIKDDSTFFISNRGDLSYSWAKGTWNTNIDTINFEYVPVYDTLIELSQNNTLSRKSLVLSCDQNPNLISLVNYNTQEFEARKFEIEMCKNQQVKSIVPQKLFIKKGKLYFFDNYGNPIKKRYRSMETNKKMMPGYRKVKNNLCITAPIPNSL